MTTQKEETMIRQDNIVLTKELVMKLANLIGDVPATASNAVSIQTALLTTLASFFLTLQLKPDEFEGTADDLRSDFLQTIQSMEARRSIWGKGNRVNSGLILVRG